MTMMQMMVMLIIMSKIIKANKLPNVLNVSSG